MSDAISDERARQLAERYQRHSEEGRLTPQYADTAALIRECLHRRQPEKRIVLAAIPVAPLRELVKKLTHTKKAPSPYLEGYWDGQNAAADELDALLKRHGGPG